MASEVLFLRLEDAESSWIALDSQGRRLTEMQHGELAEATSAAQGRRLVVLVPARDVMRTRARLPVKSSGRLRQMLPYSLEEALADDVDKLQFALGPRAGSGELDVAVVAHDRMLHWRERLATAGLAPHEIISEAEGVPDTPGSLTLIVEGRRIYGRLPERTPFMIEGLGLAAVLGLLPRNDANDAAGDGQPSVSRLLIYADRDGYAAIEPEIGALRAELAGLDVRLLEDGALAHLAATVSVRPGINLLQGRYAPRSDWAVVLRPWRFAASLAAALVMLGLVGLATEYFTLSRRDDSLTELVASSCQRLGAARMSACRSEVDRRLAAAGAAPESQDQFLETLAAIAASRDASSRITALSFRQGVLDLRVVAPSVPALDEFARRMGEASFSVSIQSASPGDDGVEGQLQVVGDRS